MIFFFKFRLNKYIAIAIWPFIIINKNYKGDNVLINHEKIHIKQQLELFWLPFFIWYFVEFLFRFLQYRNWHKAYLNISFEREANKYESDFDYLKTRKRFSFWKFL